MSDHDETTPGSGFSTPVPELDDHRHQASSVVRPDRPRRGTFDSLYGARRSSPVPSVTNPHSSATRVQDFEEAVVDDDLGDTSPTARRTRRPTVNSDYDHQRGVSPPNSVKAFAEARRQERGLSFSGSTDQDHEIRRTMSHASHYSHRSRHHGGADDAASLATNKSAEEDVCFPIQNQRHGNNLVIDFDYLESFMEAEKEEREDHQRHVPTAKAYTDARPTTNQGGISSQSRMATCDGDLVDMPCCSSVHTEKKGDDDDDESQPLKQVQTPVQDPSRVSFFSSAWESTIHASDIEGLVLPGENIRGLFSFPQGETDGVWWLNINKPSAEEVRAVCRSFGIHPLTIEDITTQEAREKIELFPLYYFACFKSFYLDKDPETDEEEYMPFHVYVVVFREGVLSFSYANNSHASHVRQRITTLKDYLDLSSDWICYALIDHIVDSFAPVISKIEHEADQIEDEVFVARTDDMHQFLRKIGSVRKNVMGLMRLLGGKADVLKGFTKRCNENYKVTPRMDIGLYLGDIQDHVVTMMTNLGHFEKMLSRSHSNYLAQISIDGIAQSTENNKVLSKITLLASIIVPLNVVTGLFGMNVKVPFQDTGNLIPFFVVLATLLLFCAVSAAYARRLRWI